MMVRISGALVAMLEKPFMIFMNKGRNYPILNVPDNILGVVY